MVTILGASVPVQRINTGLYSFDHAFINREGDIGFPIGKGVEIYGATFCGKSTVTDGLAGITAKAIGKDIALADFEGFDPKAILDKDLLYIAASTVSDSAEESVFYIVDSGRFVCDYFTSGFVAR